MTSEELREQVAAIKPGDTVTARFRRLDDSSEYTVVGVAHDGWEGALYVGHDYLVARRGEPWESLVAIESHEPAKPPTPPEPLGDVMLLAFGVVYRRQGNGEWWPLNTKGAGYEWPDLVDEWRRSREPTPVVYRREPSPERIDALVRRYAHTFDQVDDDGSNEVFLLRGFREFASALLGGEQ